MKKLSLFILLFISSTSFAIREIRDGGSSIPYEMKRARQEALSRTHYSTYVLLEKSIFGGNIERFLGFLQKHSSSEQVKTWRRAETKQSVLLGLEFHGEPIPLTKLFRMAVDNVLLSGIEDVAVREYWDLFKTDFESAFSWRGEQEVASSMRGSCPL